MRAAERGERIRRQAAFFSVGFRDYFGDDLMLGPPAPEIPRRAATTVRVQSGRPSTARYRAARMFAAASWRGYEHPLPSVEEILEWAEYGRA